MSLPLINFKPVSWLFRSKKFVTRRVPIEPVSDDDNDEGYAGDHDDDDDETINRAYKPKLMRSNAMNFTSYNTCYATINTDSRDTLSCDVEGGTRKRALENVISPCDKDKPGHELCCCLDLKISKCSI